MSPRRTGLASDQMPRRRRTARLPDNQTGLDCGTGQPRRRAIIIGSPRWAYHIVLQRNTGHPDLYW
jgi:hypothetical protein